MGNVDDRISSDESEEEMNTTTTKKSNTADGQRGDSVSTEGDNTDVADTELSSTPTTIADENNASTRPPDHATNNSTETEKQQSTKEQDPSQEQEPNRAQESDQERNQNQEAEQNREIEQNQEVEQNKKEEQNREVEKSRGEDHKQEENPSQEHEYDLESTKRARKTQIRRRKKQRKYRRKSKKTKTKRRRSSKGRNGRTKSHCAIQQPSSSLSPISEIDEDMETTSRRLSSAFGRRKTLPRSRSRSRINARRSRRLAAADRHAMDNLDPIVSPDIEDSLESISEQPRRPNSRRKSTEKRVNKRKQKE